MRLLIATHNQHKRREFARLLPGHEVIALPDDFELPPEDGETFEQNALGKARAAAALAASLGALAIADDSGIEAQALGGAPGVRSARYAGEQATDAQNLQKLLAEAPAGSSLRYVCALALVDPGAGAEQVFHGYCMGRVAVQPRGEGGFGYDPAFLPDEQPRPPSQPMGGSARGSLAGGGLVGSFAGAGSAGSFAGGGSAGSFAGGGSAGSFAGGGPAGSFAGGGPGRSEAGLLTMAEHTDAQKDEISHRGRAAREMAAWLAARQPSEGF